MGKGKTKQTKKRGRANKKKKGTWGFFFSPKRKEGKVKYRKKGGSFIAHGGRM
jgi:hypothetical protein